ncbi:MAG: hypothetical protein ACH6QR_00895 [Candidatus Carsonella ruddii]
MYIKKKIINIGFLKKTKYLYKFIIEFFLKNIKKNFFFKNKISFVIKKIFLNYVNYILNFKKKLFLKNICFYNKKKNGNLNILTKIKKINIFFFKKKYYIFNIKINI